MEGHGCLACSEQGDGLQGSLTRCIVSLDSLHMHRQSVRPGTTLLLHTTAVHTTSWRDHMVINRFRSPPAVSSLLAVLPLLPSRFAQAHCRAAVAKHRPTLVYPPHRPNPTLPSLLHKEPNSLSSRNEPHRLSAWKNRRRISSARI